MQRFVIGVLVALAVVCGSLPTSTRAAEVSRFQYSGPTAEAVFTGVEGCISTMVFVFANNQRTQSMGQPATNGRAHVAISQIDQCEWRALLWAYGETTTLTTDMFQIDQRLNAAALTMRLNAVDDISGTTGSLDVNVTWTPHGDAQYVKSTRALRTNDLLIKKRLDGTFRPAVAAGTISFNGSRNLVPEPAENQDTLISSVRYGEIEISH